MKKLALVAGIGLLAGCSWMPWSGKGPGIADYSIEPFKTDDGRIVCCKATIYNTKNVGEVALKITVNPDGSVEAYLEEKSVDSVGPAAVAAASQAETMKVIDKLVDKVPGL